MQAIALERYGGPEVLERRELPEPPIGPDGVQVEIRAAGVNPVDWKIREGYLDGAFPSHFPLVPGWDLAGVVTAVGPAIREYAVGDEVVGYVRQDHIQHGTYAERVTARTRHLAPKPSALTFTQAAGLPLAGLTAWQSLRAAGVGEGDTVLVHAAAGGVGAFAVQLAQVLGARVIGTASEANHGFLTDLGATPVTYGDGLVDRVREAASGEITAAVDYVGGDEVFAASAELVADRARITSNVDPDGIAAIGGRYVFVTPDAGELAELSRLADAGRVTVEVQEAFALADAARAHEVSQGGHVRGKLVLEVS